MGTYAGVRVEEILGRAGLTFESDKWLPAIRCPVLVLHAEDDSVVPYSLGQDLYGKAREAGKVNIRFVTYPSDLGLGHCDIYLFSGLGEEVEQFVGQLDKPTPVEPPQVYVGPPAGEPIPSGPPAGEPIPA